MAASTEATLVIDASATLAWFFADEDAESNDRILNAIARSHLTVPPIWELEVANALAVAERQERIDPVQTAHWIELLHALEYTVVGTTELSVFDIVLPLTREHGLSSYDASYLALALQRKATLVTRDTALQKAASAVGVEVMV